MAAPAWPPWALLLVLTCSIGPWIWIGMRHNTMASAWGSPAINSELRNQLPLQPSATFSEHLQGRNSWLIILAIFALLLLHEYVRVAPEYFLTVTLSYVLCWASSIGVIFFAWWRVGKQHDVQLGLLAVFFLTGGFLGVLFALALEIPEELSWLALSPTCNMMKIPMTSYCNSLSATMWILTPGLVEETGKALWLFFRLRRSVQDLPGSCCFGCFPAKRNYDCGCWYKLASTPYHVFLCALASGAGFESLENIKYVFVNSGAISHMNDPDARSTLLMTAIARSATSNLHMVWTGLIGLGLAQRLFLPEAKQPSLPMVVLPSIILHGLFDYSIAALSQLPANEQSGVIDKEEEGDLEASFFLLFLFASLGSCCILCCLTGLRSRCFGGSCCCAPGFFEARFKEPPVSSTAVAAREPLLQQQPQLQA